MNPSSRAVLVIRSFLHPHFGVSKDDDASQSTNKSIAVIYHGFKAHGRYPTVRYAAERLAAAGHAVVFG
jgi:hypothetical protein